jgi:NADH:ubiquinone oxidoreductase subunit E
MKDNNKVGSTLIVGGGIAGMQAAIDLAESGIKVYLVEKEASIGGVMSQLDKTFPTNDCAMCTMAPRLVAIGRHKDIEIIASSEVEKVEGQAGHFKVVLKKKASYIDEAKCTGCGTCVENCPVLEIVQPLEIPKVKLEPQFKERVTGIVERNKRREGFLMPILQEVNAAFNYLPENVLRYVAQETNTPLTHILRIATFYSAFSITPRGKHIINVCTGTTCYVRGSDRLMERFSDLLNVKPEETTPDMKFTLKGVRCIGCCGLAPAVMVGDVVYGKLTTAQIPDIVKRYKEA